MRTIFQNSQKASFIFCLFFYGIMFNDTTLNAQNLVLRALDSVETIFQVKHETPKGFNNLNTIRFWQPNISSPWRTLCGAFESKDKHCNVLYNVLPSHTDQTFFYHRVRMRRELESILNTKDFVIDNYLHILSIEDARKRFNADSVFLYDVPTAIIDTGEEKFTHCTRMFITKQGRLIVDLVWYFTDKGKKREDKYMQRINKRIWYHDDNWSWYPVRWEEWKKEYFNKIMDRKEF